MRKLLLNRKYRLKKDLPDQTYGKIPQGMTVTFLCSNSGTAKFRLPNGKNIGIPEREALACVEEQN